MTTSRKVGVGDAMWEIYAKGGLGVFVGHSYVKIEVPGGERFPFTGRHQGVDQTPSPSSARSGTRFVKYIYLSKLRVFLETCS